MLGPAPLRVDQKRKHDCARRPVVHLGYTSGWTSCRCRDHGEGETTTMFADEWPADSTMLESARVYLNCPDADLRMGAVLDMASRVQPGDKRRLWFTQGRTIGERAAIRRTFNGGSRPAGSRGAGQYQAVMDLGGAMLDFPSPSRCRPHYLCTTLRRLSESRVGAGAGVCAGVGLRDSLEASPDRHRRRWTP